MTAIIYLCCSIALAIVMMRVTGPDATWLQWPYVLASSALWFAITVIGYGPVANAAFWEIDRKEREAEIRAQESMIDDHIDALCDMGFTRRDAQRIVQLKQNAWWHDGLTPAEQRDLAEIQKRQPQFNPFRRAAE